MDTPALLAIAEFGLKVGSLSGLAAFAWQLRKAADDEAARLVLQTHRTTGPDLEVDIAYRPRREHAGLYVRAALVSPPSAGLSGLEARSPRDGLFDDIVRTAKALMSEREMELRLLRAGETGDEAYRTRLRISGPGLRGLATLRIEVWTKGRARRLARRTVTVCPSD